MKSITIFTESYPEGQGEQFLKPELEYIAKKFDEVILCPMGVENITLTWYKGEPKPVKLQAIRLRTLLRNHWKLILHILRFEYKNTGQKAYLRRGLHYIKNIFYAIKRANDLNTLLPKDTTFYSYWYADWCLDISILKHLFRQNIQWTTRIHGFDVDLRRVDVNCFQFRSWNNLFVDKVVSISQYGADLFLTDCPTIRDKIFVSRLAISEQKFAKLPAGKAFTIVSCSSIIPLKRVDKLARILSYLNRRLIWVHFGDGPDLPILQRNLSHLPENIGFVLKGATANSDIHAYYQNEEVDLFINTSELEGIPYSMIEAASYGIPLAGFNICGIPEIIEKTTGVLLDEESSEEANAEKLKSFLISGLSRDENYRLAIQNQMKQKFSADMNFTKFCELLN
jgi:glycosyltransferase involved in cell wall biosynthesis